MWQKEGERDKLERERDSNCGSPIVARVVQSRQSEWFNKVVSQSGSKHKVVSQSRTNTR